MNSIYDNKADITVRGKGKHRKLLVEKASRWMLSHLLGKRQANYISLEIVLDDTLKKTDYMGYVIWEDCNIKPRMFTMHLCPNLDDEKLLKVIAHEMVHIRQYVRGDLREYMRETKHCRWKDELIKVIGKGSIPYNKLPWEKEAMAEEKIIFRAWCDYHNISFDKRRGFTYNDN